MSDTERRAIEALRELVAEIDAGHLGRLTRIDGMRAWQETAGTEMARDVLATLKPVCCGPWSKPRSDGARYCLVCLRIVNSA